MERVDTRAGGVGLGPPGARITYKDEHETKWEPYVDAAKNSLARATLKLEPLHREDLTVSFYLCSSKVFLFFSLEGGCSLFFFFDKRSEFENIEITRKRISMSCVFLTHCEKVDRGR